MGKIGFLQDLTRGIKKVLGLDKPKPVAPAPQAVATHAPVGASVDSLIKRAWLFLDDGDTKQANEYFDRVLDTDPEYAPAYVGKLCIELGMKDERELASNRNELTEYSNFQKALRFADDEYKAKLNRYNQIVVGNIEEKRRIAEEKRQEAIRLAEAKKQEDARVAKENTEKRRKQTKRNIKLAAKVAIFAFVGFLLFLLNSNIISPFFENRSAQAVFSQMRPEIESFEHLISASHSAISGITADGSVVIVGNPHLPDLSDWQDIVSARISLSNIAGLRADDTVIVATEDRTRSWLYDTEEWSDIVAISMGNDHMVGLDANGRVVAVGSNISGQLDVDEWRNIVDVSAYGNRTTGVMSNGRVVAVGPNVIRQAEMDGWRNIVAVSETSQHSVGLMSNGRVVAVGSNSAGQIDVDNWMNIVAISAAGNVTVGLRSDGTVVATGNIAWGMRGLSDWQLFD